MSGPTREYTETCPAEHQAGIGAIASGAGPDDDFADWRAYCTCGWEARHCGSRGGAEGAHAEHVRRVRPDWPQEPPA